MKKQIRIIVYFYILMFSFHLAAESVESVLPEKGLVAEKIRYQLKWNLEEVKDIQIPEMGIHFLEDSPDIPWFEILYSEKKDNSLVVDFVFYVTGKFTVPIFWTDANGKKSFLKRKF